MENVEYLAVSFSLVWILMVSYLMYLHALTRNLSRRLDGNESSIEEDDNG